MRTDISALPLHKNFVKLQNLLRSARTPDFGRGIMDFPNLRMVSDDGTQVLQWSDSPSQEGTITPIKLNQPIDVSTLNRSKAKPAKRPARARKPKASKEPKSRKSKRKSSKDDNIVLTEIFLDPDRPTPPAAQDIPAGHAWLRRNLPAFISQAMPEDVRPNGKGIIVSLAEAKLAGRGFWDIVESAQT